MFLTIPTYSCWPVLFYIASLAFQPVRRQTYSFLLNNSYDDDDICFLFPLAICLQIKLITLEMRFANYLTWSNPISHSSIKILGGKTSETNVLHIHNDQSTRILIHFLLKKICFTFVSSIMTMRHTKFHSFSFKISIGYDICKAKGKSTYLDLPH